MPAHHPLRTTKAVAGALCAALALVAGSAQAERPMNVDDAGTVGLGGIEVDFGWFRDDKVRGVEGGVGYGLTENLQIGVALDYARDTDASPDVKAKGVGVSLKWIPVALDNGLTAGLAVDWAHAKAEVDGGPEDSATAKALTALASMAFDSGLNAHLNLSREWVKGEGAENGWGLGADYGLTEQVAVTAEIFGSQHGAPDKSVGLRYEIREGVKVSASIGRGNDRTFATVGALLTF